MRDPWTRHEQLAPESGCVCAAADAVGDAPTSATRSRIDRAYDFLTHRFLPNARDEQRIRHRLADRDHRHVIGDRELEEIDDLTDRLGALKAKLAVHSSIETIRELRQVLYELAAFLRMHYEAPMAADTRI